MNQMKKNRKKKNLINNDRYNKRTAQKMRFFYFSPYLIDFLSLNLQNILRTNVVVWDLVSFPSEPCYS
jgi:hypothetical protein